MVNAEQLQCRELAFFKSQMYALQDTYRANLKSGRKFSMRQLLTSHLKNSSVHIQTPNFTRLMQIVVLAPLGSVPNERCHWYMDLILGDIRQSLQEEHRDVCAKLFTTRFTESTFPYERAVRAYTDKCSRRGEGMMM
jgi:hypothetical protein